MLTVDKITAHRRANGTRCGVSVIREAITAKERAVLDEAITNPQIPAAAICRALRDEGHTLTGNSLTRHRRKECTCA